MSDRWIGQSAQYAYDSFDPQRLTFAREMRGHTKMSLAKLIEKSGSAVTQFEKGQIKPDLTTLIRISEALEIPTAISREKQLLYWQHTS